MDKLNILIVCEHASNVYGGEAMLPLNYFRLLSKDQNNQVYLITHARVKASIEQLVDIKQDQVFYMPDTKAHQVLNKYSSLLPDRISLLTFGFLMHLLTQFYQWKLAREIVKTKNIDILHEPAPVSAVLPSAMFWLGVPVVIGPMNGGMTFPPAFNTMAGWLERLLYQLTRLLSSVFNILIPGKFFADILLVANQRTKDALPKLRLGRVLEIVENGVFSVVDTPKKAQAKPITDVLYVGRLVDWKAVDIAIDAINTCKSNVKLTILGDGPLKNELVQYAKKFAPSKVVFAGMVPHEKTNQYYDEADIFILPSVRECGGAVVLEAMSRGLPAIVTAWGGPADYISKETGFLIEPKSRAYMTEQFALIIDRLAHQPNLRYEIGQAAINRVKQHFMWDKKIQNMMQVYQKAIEGTR